MISALCPARTGLLREQHMRLSRALLLVGVFLFVFRHLLVYTVKSVASLATLTTQGTGPQPHPPPDPLSCSAAKKASISPSMELWFISWSYAHYPGSLVTISAEPSILVSLFLDESQTPSDSSFMILEGWMTDTAGSGPVSVGWLEYTVWKDGKSYSAETCLLLHSRGVVLITDVSAAAGPQDGLVNCTPG